MVNIKFLDNAFYVWALEGKQQRDIKVNKAKLVAKRIKRKKRIKRGSVAFQGYSITIYTPIDNVKMKDNQTTKQRFERSQWIIRCVLPGIFRCSVLCLVSRQRTRGLAEADKPDYGRIKRETIIPRYCHVEGRSFCQNN